MTHYKIWTHKTGPRTSGHLIALYYKRGKLGWHVQYDGIFYHGWPDGDSLKMPYSLHVWCVEHCDYAQSEPIPGCDPIYRVFQFRSKEKAKVFAKELNQTLNQIYTPNPLEILACA